MQYDPALVRRYLGIPDRRKAYRDAYRARLVKALKELGFTFEFH
jgi:hypothetical protein